MQVKLTVRTPSVCGKDLELEVSLEWSVGRLKEEIQRLFESHPRPEDQRLVYAGKLLDNHSTLDRVLRLGDSADDDVRSHTVHLVCRQQQSSFTETKKATTTQAQKIESSELRQRTRPLQTPAESYPPVSERQEETEHEQPSQDHHFHMHAWATMLQHYSGALIDPHNHAHHQEQQHSHDQTTWTQNMYAQYLAQYAHYMHTAAAAAAASTAGGSLTAASSAFLPPPPANAADNPFSFGNAAANERDNGAANAAPAPEAQAARGGGRPVNAQPPNVVLNAGGAAVGAMDDDEEMGGQRDILDWFYIASRVLLLFSIVYFYSSLARFLIVTGLGLLVYLWNMGFFRNQEGQQQEERQQQRGQVDEREMLRRQVDEVRQAATGENNPRESREEEQGEQGVQEGIDQQERNGAEGETVGAAVYSATDTLITFVTTLFSSLLPDQPQVV